MDKQRQTSNGMRFPKWPWKARRKREEFSTIEIIPTCVPASEDELALASKKISEFADSIHIDVGDGAFSPVLTWPFDSAHGRPFENGEAKEGFNLSAIGKLKAEVHLMIEEPRELGMLFARAGAKRIIGHIEAFSNTAEAHGTLDLWRRSGAEAGLGILLHTPFEVIEPLIQVSDVVHMMSIATIGTQGIAYEPSAPARIAAFHEKYPDALISVDGGVSEKNIAELARAGVRRFGVGSAITKTIHPAASWRNLKALAESAI